MAIRYATKSGDWVDPTVWDGGTLPTSADDVRTNNFVVNITTSIDVTRLANYYDPVLPIVYGGRFTITPTGNITVAVSNGIRKTDQGQTNTQFITILAGSGNVTITVPLLCGSIPTSSNTVLVSAGYTGAIVVNGNVMAGGRGTPLRVLAGATPSSVTINGNVLGTDEVTGGNTVSGLHFQGSTVCHIYGDVIGTGVGSSYSLILASAGLSVYVHGESKGVVGAQGVSSLAININTSASNLDTYLYLEGDVTSYVGAGGAVGTSRGYVRASNVVFTGPNAFFNGSPNPARLSGVIYGINGGLAASGSFVVISGETLDIWRQDDSDFPTSMNGTPMLFVPGSAPTNVLVAGNAAEVDARAEGMLFTIAEDDADHVLLGMPDTLASQNEVLVLAEQVQEVFAPPSVITSGWLTVTAKGILGMADSADPDSAPDFVPLAGTVTFTPSVQKPLRQLSTQDILLVSAIVATFDSNGVLSYDGVPDVRLVAPQWSDLSNTAWTWRVELRASAGQSWPAFAASFSGAPGATIDLASLIT